MLPLPSKVHTPLLLLLLTPAPAPAVPLLLLWRCSSAPIPVSSDSALQVQHCPEHAVFQALCCDTFVCQKTQQLLLLPAALIKG
jgi:hypothetical protein